MFGADFRCRQNKLIHVGFSWEYIIDQFWLLAVRSFTRSTISTLMPIVDGFYDPLKALVDGAVKSGFITSTNQSLLTIIDLPGSSAEEWGKASMNHLEEWSVKVHVLHIPPGFELTGINSLGQPMV